MSLPAPAPNASALDRLNQLLECCACARTFHAPEGTPRHELLDQACPHCGAADCKAHRPASEKSLAGKGSLGIGGRSWRGQEAVCMELPTVAAKDQANWKRDLPSADWDSKGRFVFRSDQHQRQVYREWGYARERMKEKRDGQ